MEIMIKVTEVKEETNIHERNYFLLNPRSLCRTECRYCVSFLQPVNKTRHKYEPLKQSNKHYSKAHSLQKGHLQI